jgi:hypothetical protein
MRRAQGVASLGIVLGSTDLLMLEFVVSDFVRSPACCGCLPAHKIHELIGELVRMVPCVLSRSGNEIQRHKHAGMPHIDHRHGWDKQNLSKFLI